MTWDGYLASYRALPSESGGEPAVELTVKADGVSEQIKLTLDLGQLRTLVDYVKQF